MVGRSRLVGRHNSSDAQILGGLGASKDTRIMSDGAPIEEHPSIGSR